MMRTAQDTGYISLCLQLAKLSEHKSTARLAIIQYISAPSTLSSLLWPASDVGYLQVCCCLLSCCCKWQKAPQRNRVSKCSPMCEATRFIWLGAGFCLGFVFSTVHFLFCNSCEFAMEGCMSTQQVICLSQSMAQT